jgi:CheY-like chemotaxis protein/two-component sensor histidine kinase
VRDIVRSLKLFSRPEETADQSVDVREVLRSTVSLAQNEIRHRAQLVLDLAEVPNAAGSATRLGQVFLNLVINAAQAIDEGDADRNTIRVACRPSDDGRVLVEIGDTGCGIPPELLARIFDPFFTTKPVGVGSGLGLSICHGIVTALGGEIGVESRRGQGSTFRVLLPAAPPRALEPAKPRSPCEVGSRARIMVIDDEPMVVNAVRRTLGEAHDVVALTSARAALSRLEEDPTFDVLICDLMMPEMTGMQLHERLSEIGRHLSERMVFLTGGAFTPLAREFLDTVPNLRLEKPFDPQALRAAVSDALCQHA